MQGLARTSSLGTAYTAAQVAAVLGGPVVQERWAFDRLSATLKWVSDLTPFVDRSFIPEIDHDSSRAVRRTLRIRITGNATLTPLHDFIRPHHLILMPDGGWIDFVLGTFGVLPTSGQIGPSVSTRDLLCPDVSQLLVDAGFPVSTGLSGGGSVIAGVQTLVSNYGGLTPIPMAIPDPGTVLPVAIGWEYGTSPLKAANDLLAALNYFSAAADETGTLRSAPIPDWNVASPVLAFDLTQGAAPSASQLLTIGNAAVAAPISMQPDFSRAFNIAIVLIEDPRRPTLSATVSNNRGESLISRSNWHDKTQVIRDARVVDAATAYAVGLAAIQEAARIYNPIIVSTTAWPVSQDQDVYRLIYSTPDEGTVAANYVELRWTHRCKPGEKTTHTLARIVPAGP